MREIIDGGPVTLAQPVQGLDDLRAALDGFDRATAARDRRASTEQELDDLLAAIRRKGEVVVETGTGADDVVDRQRHPMVRWVLTILTGKMNRKGGIWFHPGFITATTASNCR